MLAGDTLLVISLAGFLLAGFYQFRFGENREIAMGQQGRDRPLRIRDATAQSRQCVSFGAAGHQQQNLTCRDNGRYADGDAVLRNGKLALGLHGVRGAGLGAQRDHVRLRRPIAAGLIEADVPVGAQPEDGQIQSAGRRNRRLVVAAFRLDPDGVAPQQPNMLLRHAGRHQEMLS